jgi:deoxyribodipyrimidine photo-lyase
MSTALWWIRRDLRLTDNQALTNAMQMSTQVLPVFVIDPELLNSPYTGERRLAFLYDGLRALDSDLRQRGSRLVVRRGDPLIVLKDLLHEQGADRIFAEEDYSPYSRRRDQKISKDLPLHLTPGLTVHPPGTVIKADKSPYTVFTPFSKAWLAQPWTGDLLPAPDRIPSPLNIKSEAIPVEPRSSAEFTFQAGEKEAQNRLATFVEHVIHRYQEDRNRMDLEGTSGLSPYLRLGMLSARQAVAAANQAQAQAVDGPSRRGAETWLNELIWREFYIAILYHFPFVRQTAFRSTLRNLPWMNYPDDFAAWTQARTGYPVVDAAMRQLASTGWMHNRARMITASFLVKDLLVDWRWGERWFMQNLIDGDPAANNGGWQWTAGTGTDAAPYFRVFNPVLQGQKFDPDGNYARRWLPELSQVPVKFIHNPWEMSPDLQKKVGCVIGNDYPPPIIDHAFARQRALDVYRKARETDL